MTDVNDTAPNLAHPVKVDYMPLIVPVTKQEIAQFKTESRRGGAEWAGSSVGRVLAWVFGGIFIVIWLAVMVTTVLPMMSRGGGSFTSIIPIIIAVAVIAVCIKLFGGARGKWEKLLRATRFAATNGLIYVHKIVAPRYPGSLFDVGSSRNAFGNYRRPFAPELDMGSYRYTTGSGKNKSTHTWGYVAIKLPRKLPNMLLDARSNNSLFGTNLPVSYRRDQVLSLEGDFDKYFTLYCPRQYERDALYVFTPDLMALLIDESAAFDVEIADDWMFLYRNGQLKITDAATVQRIFTIIDTVGAKARRQTTRYADERIGDPSVDYVAPQGQRLKKGVNWVMLGVVAVAVVWMFFTFAGNGFFG